MPLPVAGGSTFCNGALDCEQFWTELLDQDGETGEGA